MLVEHTTSSVAKTIQAARDHNNASIGTKLVIRKQSRKRKRKEARGGSDLNMLKVTPSKLRIGNRRRARDGGCAGLDAYDNMRSRNPVCSLFREEGGWRLTCLH